MQEPMRINSPWRSWTMGCALAFAAALVAMAWEAHRDPDAWRGGSTSGLAVGAVALLLMWASLALRIRRALRAYNLGPASTWLRLHILGGGLALGLAVLHSGLKSGGPVATALWALLMTVLVSGLVGLWIRRVTPHRLRVDVPLETIASQMASVVGHLSKEAETLIQGLHRHRPGAGPMGETSASGVDEGDVPTPLETFHETVVRPYLNDQPSPLDGCLRNIDMSPAFIHMRAVTPTEEQTTLDRLAMICEEVRQFRLQLELQNRLEGWLLVHLPAGYALGFLATVHAIASLYY